MTATLEDGPLESRLLDVGRDDYYGHAGSWDDVQDSLFLERLDSPDRAAPTVPTLPEITSDRDRHRAPHVEARDGRRRACVVPGLPGRASSRTR